MIDWLVQTEADLPALPAEAWLSPTEQVRLAGLRVAKRRHDWLLGRWTAKRLVQICFARERGADVPDLALIEIVPAPDGAPELRLHGLPVSPDPQRTLTISHSAGRAFCALGPPGVALGADIELVTPHPASFCEQYLTLVEQDLIRATPSALHASLITAIWSAKEALLKALRVGLTVDTRMVECLPLLSAHGLPQTWQPVQAACDPSLGAAGVPRCWWRTDETFVLTLALLG